MGVIKTALEIALEKTESVKGDKTSVNQFEARQKGKKLANAFLGKEANIADELKKAQDSDKESLKQGVFDVLSAQISLPAVKDDEEKLKRIGEGLSAIINNKEFNAMYSQFLEIVSQYLQESSQYEQMIRQQYAPKLRQKEEELSRRMGREVRIDPLQDPEFIAFYNQHMNAIKGNYEPVIEHAKEETRKMFYGEPGNKK